MVVYAPAQIISAPALLITPPAQPPATGAVVYTALFFWKREGERKAISTLFGNSRLNKAYILYQYE